MSEYQNTTAPGGCRGRDREAAADCFAQSRDNTADRLAQSGADTAERLSQSREAAIKRLVQALSRHEEYGIEELENLLWDTLVLFQGYPFHTAKKLEFTYSLKGYEMFVSRKEKSLTKASIMLAFRKALELERMVSGPKKLGTFGASYLYPVFLHLKVIFR